MKVEVMKQFRILLAIFLLWVGGAAVLAEEITDAQGITYETYTISGETGYFARITYAYSSDFSLTIPDKVTMANGSQATVTGFSKSFTCYCRNVSAIYIKESTYDEGTFAGDFTGMPHLGIIWFYYPPDDVVSTNKSWMLDPSTRFVENVDVYLSETVRPYVVIRNSYYYNSYPLSWKRHEKVNEIHCNSQYKDRFIGYAPVSGNTFAGLESAIMWINPGTSGKLVVPAWANSWQVSRLGYTSVKTPISCPFLTTLEFAGDIYIDGEVDFTGCTELSKLIFQGNAAIWKAVFPTESGKELNIEQIDFHGDAAFGKSLKNLPNLKKVYFYGEIPTISSPYETFYNSGSDITFYVNMDIYEIAEWKENNPNWQDLNLQPIDPRSSYRKVTINNPGAGTFKVRRQYNNHVTWEIIGPNTTRTTEVDKGALLWVKDVVFESTEYSLNCFVFNESHELRPASNGAEATYAYVTEKTNTLTAYYHKLDYPAGTVFNIHFTKVGDGEMNFRDTDENEWAGDGEGNYQTLYNMVQDGEEHDYTCTYYEYQDMNISFECWYEKPQDGIVESTRVVANGVPVEKWRTEESGGRLCDTYIVTVDGDMDIRVINENNARRFSAVNGPGGTIALYRAGESESVATIDNGTSMDMDLPKADGHYAVITPNEGKTVAAIFVNKPLGGSERLHLDPSNYIEEGDVCRVPLTGFDEGEDTYRLNVLYADKPCLTFDLSVLGDGKFDCLPCRNDDGQMTVLQDVLVSEQAGRHQIVKVYYDEIGENGYVEFRVFAPKEGTKLKVYWSGEDVTGKFTPMSSSNDLLRGTIAVLPTSATLGELKSSSMLVIYEDADIIQFADENVKAICVENWDANGDGELSKREAAAVTTLKTDHADGTYGDPVFKGNTNITSFDELAYFTGLTSIESGAFNGCTNLKTVVVPEGVETIADEAFIGCTELLTVSLPDGLTKIGSSAFQSASKLFAIRLPETLTEIESFAFRYCSSLRSVVLPANIQKLGAQTFMLTGLNTLNIPAKVTSVGETVVCGRSLLSVSVASGNTKYNSADNCNAIINSSTHELISGSKYAKIPAGVLKIGNYAFAYLTIDELEIPSAVESIGYAAFTQTQLESIVCKGTTPPTLESNSFAYMLSNCKLTVPRGTRDAYINAGWTEDIFKGGVVEAEPEPTSYDVNGDGSVTIADVTKLVNVILGKDK